MCRREAPDLSLNSTDILIVHIYDISPKSISNSEALDKICIPIFLWAKQLYVTCKIVKNDGNGKATQFQTASRSLVHIGPQAEDRMYIQDNPWKRFVQQSHNISFPLGINF